MSDPNKKDTDKSQKATLILWKKQARELALALLFQKEFPNPPPPVDQWPILFDRPLSAEVIPLTHALIQGVMDHLGPIDADIQSLATHWKIERMNLIDKNALRLGLYEMKYQADPLPAPIVINEYVELVKRFGTKDSGAFVNGILDQASKQISWQSSSRKPS